MALCRLPSVTPTPRVFVWVPRSRSLSETVLSKGQLYTGDCEGCAILTIRIVYRWAGHEEPTSQATLELCGICALNLAVLACTRRDLERDDKCTHHMLFTLVYLMSADYAGFRGAARATYGKGRGRQHEGEGVRIGSEGGGRAGEREVSDTPTMRAVPYLSHRTLGPSRSAAVVPWSVHRPSTGAKSSPLCGYHSAPTRCTDLTRGPGGDAKPAEWCTKRRRQSRATESAGMGAHGHIAGG